MSAPPRWCLGGGGGGGNAPRFSLCYRLTHSPSLSRMVSGELVLGPTPSPTLKWDHCRWRFQPAGLFHSSDSSPVAT